MWPLPPINDKHLYITLHQDHLSCYWVTSQDNTAFIEAHQHYDIPFLSPDVMYNQTAIQRMINAFITEHNLAYCYCHYVLHAPFIHEQLLPHIKGSAQLEELIQDQHIHMYYDYDYIGPYNEQFLFYVCSMAQPMLLQLKMMHKQLPCYLQSVSSSFSVQFNLYKHLHASYNQTHLIESIDKEKIIITSLFSPELLQLHVRSKKEYEYDHDLVYVLGSFLGSL